MRPPRRGLRSAIFPPRPNAELAPRWAPPLAERPRDAHRRRQTRRRIPGPPLPRPARRHSRRARARSSNPGRSRPREEAAVRYATVLRRESSGSNPRRPTPTRNVTRRPPRAYCTRVRVTPYLRRVLRLCHGSTAANVRSSPSREHGVSRRASVLPRRNTLASGCGWNAGRAARKATIVQGCALHLRRP